MARLDDKLGVYPERPLVSATERSLLDAVLAAPEDRGPRLVYADYLLVRTEPELHARGELIVTQYKLDDLLASAPPELRSREHELLDHYGRTWTSWIGFRGPRWNVEFRGGFMEDVEIHATNIAIAARLFTSEPVRRLVITEPTEQLGRLETMVFLERLHTFGLRDTHFGAPRIAQILASPHLHAIRGLVLEHSRLTSVALDHLAELTELRVAHNQISDVSSLVQLPLRVLDVSHNPVNVAAVAQLCAMTTLERLDVRSCPISQHGIARLRERFGAGLLD